jgi:hypothetical protein
MGLRSFLQKLINGNSLAEEQELNAARARHGIAPEDVEAAFRNAEERRQVAEFDAWEELKYFKTDFIMGNWVSKKIRPFFGIDNLKKDMNKLEEKRRQEDLRLMEKERLEAERKKTGEG